MRLALPLMIALAGCSSTTGVLIIQVRTDLVPGSELDEIEVEMMPFGATSETVAGTRNWQSGVRVAEFADLDPDTRRLVVRARLAGTVVVERPVRVDVMGGRTQVVTVLLTRDCRGVVCPDSADATAVACLGGRCVPEGCTEETPDLCPAPACTPGDACDATNECFVGQCSESGACVQILLEDPCGVGAVCEPDIGCVGGCGWGPPEPIPAIVALGVTARDPALANDDESLFFVGGSAITQIFEARRVGSSGPFMMPVPVDLMRAGFDIRGPTVGASGTRIIYSSQGGGDFFDLHEARRADSTSRWEMETQLTSLSSTDEDGGAHLSPDGLEVHFHAEGAGIFNLFVAARPGIDSPFERMEPLAAINTRTESQRDPYVAAGGLELWYWTSDGSGNTGDIWRATRNRPDAEFADPQPVTELNTTGFAEGQPTINRAGDVVFFWSDREGVPGQIYRSLLVCAAP